MGLIWADYDIKIRGDEPPDSPDEYRWRAWWDSVNDSVIGIRFERYPVLKKTPVGAWIDRHAWLHGTWTLSGDRKWVSDMGGAAWAKPTKDEALRSIIIRYRKWASRLRSDVDYFRAAGNALKTIRPDLERDVQELIEAVT